MSSRPLRLAVVGHTNTGKTSLVRTLLRSSDFGQVADRGGTTRQVTSSALTADGEVLVELFDSPGLENAPELIDTLEQLSGQRHDGPERIAMLLDNEQLRQRFDHEARVLELMLDTDVALYVIDAREPVLEKYKDELDILGHCGKPIVAVLNFTATAASLESEWRDALARVRLHSVLAFDAVVRDPATETRLFEKLASLLDEFEPMIQRWLDHRRTEELQRDHAALTAIAEMLIDLAAYREHAPEAGQETAWETMQQRARQREQACVDTLLDLYRFGREDRIDDDLPLSGGRWEDDLFDTETLKHYGIRTGTWTGIGAGAGAAVDVGTGGLTLGTGTLAGALIGTSAGLARSFGQRIKARVRGEVQMMIDEATLRLLASRQVELHAALVRRGHASQTPVHATDHDLWKDRRLPRVLAQARHHPEWSSLASGLRISEERNRGVEALVRQLECVRDELKL
jgi:GTPase SAR1 family protein